MRSLSDLVKKNILWLLAAKLLALVTMYLLFFGPEHRVRVNSHGVESHLFDGHVNDRAGSGE